MYFLYSARGRRTDGPQRCRPAPVSTDWRPSPVPAAPPDQRVDFIDKQNGGLGLACTSSMTCRSLLEFALHAGARLQQADNRASATELPFNCGGTSPMARRRAEALDHRRLADPASPVRIGLFCRRRIGMSTIWRISSSRPSDRIDSPFFRFLLRSVDGVFLRRLLLAHCALAPLHRWPPPVRPPMPVRLPPACQRVSGLSSTAGQLAGQRRIQAPAGTPSRCRASSTLHNSSSWPVADGDAAALRTCASPYLSVRVHPVRSTGHFEVLPDTSGVPSSAADDPCPWSDRLPVGTHQPRKWRNERTMQTRCRC